MNRLQVLSVDFSATKRKAIDDARKAQAAVVKDCTEVGREPPPYELHELIGKGSFGRVYKALNNNSRQLVAVKIIDIEEGDSLAPGANDTFSDILKEVNTLKLLNNNGAKNINVIVDAFLVGPSIWMVTEYCAGGSVATLMRPTGGLPEKWIIPILREVAEALFWVHHQGIIHRDLKCANVLVTENGCVQLCDFGVAGIIETKFDKRRTVTGTLQWMAPELFELTVSYGIEVDIWAFGSMAYEVASGFPPNTTTIADMDFTQFCSYLKQHCPRLEGHQYSLGLKDIIAYCLIEDPAQRPTINDVQRHQYIFNTTAEYPTSSLSQLVHDYRLWELQGGTRRSLFSAGGAQGRHSTSPGSVATDEEWDFNMPDDADQLAFDDQDPQTVLKIYSQDINLPLPPSNPQPRRRRPPPHMRQIVTPLEKAFDPNTIINYHENVHAFYGRTRSSEDLPLRNNSEHSTVRESLIDLDASLDGGRLSRFADSRTVRESLIDLDASLGGSRLSRFADSGTIKMPPRSLSSDRLVFDTHRRTLEWSFPVMQPASASLVEPTFQLDKHKFQAQTEPDQSFDQDFTHSSRNSTTSLIDLDNSLDFGRPSTGYSDAVSTLSDTEESPFRLQRHVYESPYVRSSTREPSIYTSADFKSDEEPSLYAPGILESNPISRNRIWDSRRVSTAQFEMLQQPNADPHLGWDVAKSVPPPLPSQPLPPSTIVMQGASSGEELKEEVHRLVISLNEHLQYASDVMGALFIPSSRRYEPQETLSD